MTQTYAEMLALHSTTVTKLVQQLAPLPVAKVHLVPQLPICKQE